MLQVQASQLQHGSISEAAESGLLFTNAHPADRVRGFVPVLVQFIHGQIPQVKKNTSCFLLLSCLRKASRII